MNNGSFQGKTALVTGAGSGIGRHVAIALAGEGARLFLAGRRLAELEETAALVGKAGGEAICVSTDVADEASVEALINRVRDEGGQLDIAINAAGIFRSGATDDMALDAFQSVFAVNTTGVWLSMKHELRLMRPAGTGVIVNIGSNIGARLAPAMLGAYAASKAAVSSLTRSAALEAIAYGVRVNAVCPGPVDTPLSIRPNEDKAGRDARIATTNPSGRVATLDEIASTILFLCSDGAGYVVGQNIIVDGGASV